MKNQNFKIKTWKRTILFLGISIFIFSSQCIAQEALYEPVPVVVTPGILTSPPSDAIILLDGTSLNEWESTKKGEAKWKLEDGGMSVVPGTGSIKTKRSFGDCQLHIEWRSPAIVKGDSQDRGNSGIFLQGHYEVQVLDSYNSKTYVNGQAGSIYKQYIPLVNACRPPGEWQAYDIIFKAPEFKENGDLLSPGYITVLQNNVLIQNHVELKGNTAHGGKPTYKKHGKLPISLQDHGSTVSYRNIWIREL
jgi:hypothetical protein